MDMKVGRALRALLVVLSAGWLAACGGSDGAAVVAPGTLTRAPLPTLSEDINPTGARIEVQSLNYFPAVTGDRWVYSYLQGADSVWAGTFTRSVTAVDAAGNVATAETNGLITDTQMRYRRTEEGVSIVPLAASAPQVVQEQVGRLLQYPEPFYGVGEARVVVRQGNWGEDLDGDGVSESFRFEFRQTLISLGTLTVASQTLSNVAQFRNVLTLTVQPSDLAESSYSVTSVENAWWAPGIGLVRYEYRADGSDGAAVTTPYALVLASGTVGGQTLFVPGPDGVVTKIALAHNDVVYDATRGVFYASVPGNAVSNSNRIATIDAATGSVTYSATTVGSDPGELAVSADGTVLYVALKGAGTLVKLALPGMSQLQSVTMPLDAFFGQLYVENMVVSPVNADAVAVALAASNLSPRHRGVALVKGGVVQVKRTQVHTGSNLISFDGSGQYLYGYNSETTEFGLRRIAVLADGLSEQKPVVGTSNTFYLQSLDWAGERVVVGRKVYQTPALTLTGTAPSVGGLCVWINAGARLVCASDVSSMSPVSPALEVVSGTSWAMEAKLVYQVGYGAGYLRQIVAGPEGTVALSMDANGGGFVKTGDRLWLFRSPALQ
jgi:hypothetical protein